MVDLNDVLYLEYLMILFLVVVKLILIYLVTIESLVQLIVSL